MPGKAIYLSVEEAELLSEALLDYEDQTVHSGLMDSCPYSEEVINKVRSKLNNVVYKRDRPLVTSSPKDN